MYKVEEAILDKNFDYEMPWFYNNNLALRCELGIGNGRKYLKNAKKRAKEIFNILFKNGVDRFFYNSYKCDYDIDNDEMVYINILLKIVKKELKSSLEYQMKFKHEVVRDIPFDREDNEDLIKINRIICCPNKKFNAVKIINKNILSTHDPQIHFVSFENECIFSIYDDRGCDIVFFDKEKFKKNYPLLEKYFLDYDRNLMKQRLDEEN